MPRRIDLMLRFANFNFAIKYAEKVENQTEFINHT